MSLVLATVVLPTPQKCATASALSERIARATGQPFGEFLLILAADDKGDGGREIEVMLDRAFQRDKALAGQIAKFAAQHAALLLANHGPVVSGNDLDSAMYAIEELEETSKLMLLLHGQKIRTLDKSEIQELKETFGAQWES